MKKSLILSIMLCLACGMQAKKWTARDVVAIINKVNNYWQANNKAEVRSFWDHAAYHTGNMEAYLLTKNSMA